MSVSSGMFLDKIQIFYGGGERGDDPKETFSILHPHLAALLGEQFFFFCECKIVFLSNGKQSENVT